MKKKSVENILSNNLYPEKLIDHKIDRRTNYLQNKNTTDKKQQFK